MEAFNAAMANALLGQAATLMQKAQSLQSTKPGESAKLNRRADQLKDKAAALFKKAGKSAPEISKSLANVASAKGTAVDYWTIKIAKTRDILYIAGLVVGLGVFLVGSALVIAQVVANVTLFGWGMAGIVDVVKLLVVIPVAAHFLSLFAYIFIQYPFEKYQLVKMMVFDPLKKKFPKIFSAKPSAGPSTAPAVPSAPATPPPSTVTPPLAPAAAPATPAPAPLAPPTGRAAARAQAAASAAAAVPAEVTAALQLIEQSGIQAKHKKALLKNTALPTIKDELMDFEDEVHNQMRGTDKIARGFLVAGILSTCALFGALILFMTPSSILGAAAVSVVAGLMMPLAGVTVAVVFLALVFYLKTNSQRKMLTIEYPKLSQALENLESQNAATPALPRPEIRVQRPVVDANLLELVRNVHRLRTEPADVRKLPADTQILTEKFTANLSGLPPVFAHAAAEQIKGLQSPSEILAKLDSLGLFGWQKEAVIRGAAWRMGPEADNFATFADHQDAMFKGFEALSKGDTSFFEGRVLGQSLAQSLLSDLMTRFKGLSAQERFWLALAVTFHDYGRLITTGPMHPLIGNTLVTAILEKMGMDEKTVELIASLTSRELEYGSLPFGEAVPSKVMAGLSHADVPLFLKLMGFVYLLDVAAVGNGKLTSVHLKNAAFLQVPKNFRNLAEDWPLYRAVAYSEPHEGITMDLSLPPVTKNVPPNLLAEIEAHAGQNEFGRFLSRVPTQRCVYILGELVRQGQPENVAKFLYVLIMLQQLGRFDFIGMSTDRKEYAIWLNNKLSAITLSRLKLADFELMNGRFTVRASGIDMELDVQTEEKTKAVVSIPAAELQQAVTVTKEGLAPVLPTNEKDRAELRNAAPEAPAVRPATEVSRLAAMTAAARSLEEAQFPIVKRTLRNKNADRFELALEAKLSHFAADPEVLSLINSARTEPLIIPTINGLNQRIVKYSDLAKISEMIVKFAKYASTVSDDAGLVFVGVRASDIGTVRALLRKYGVKAEAFEKPAEMYLRDKKLLKEHVVTQIHGAETLDALRYAQILAGAAQLGVVVLGVEQPITGTQSLYVTEIFSATYEAAKAVGRSA